MRIDRLKRIMEAAVKLSLKADTDEMITGNSFVEITDTGLRIIHPDTMYLDGKERLTWVEKENDNQSHHDARSDKSGHPVNLGDGKGLCKCGHTRQYHVTPCQVDGCSSVCHECSCEKFEEVKE